MIDLRSDTVTRPTAEMRQAMAAAEVGDDVYGEDPTVNLLEATAAERMGRQAALYCPSGVMCNQLWVRVLGRPGEEMLCEADSHIVNYEAGAAATLGGAQFRTIPGVRGLLEPRDVAAALRPRGFSVTPTGLVWLEQTHNRRGGTVTDLARLEAIADVARTADVRVYMDGARIFNAAVAEGVDPARYAGLVDGLSFCTSKALGAPIGSLMVGDADAIAEARAWRRRYGGAMRQAGVVAAASLYALTHRVARLAEDHAHAQLLATAAAEVAGDRIDPAHVETNIVLIEPVPAEELVRRLAAQGVAAGAMDAQALRLVTHPDVSEADCRRAADALRRSLEEVLAEASAPTAHH